MEPEHLVLYDGTCGFCQRTVQWVLREDARGVFRFAPLQGATAAAVRTRHPDLPLDLDSLVYVERSGGTERTYTRFDAVFRICGRLGGSWAWLGWLRLLPHVLTDPFYRAFARNRHRVSRALGACPLPPPSAQARFLP
jgi:predicted DCC family thiol-disulfide oxidoreductase YuxK